MDTESKRMIDYGVCDLHGHFLPGMDDGSKSVEMSVSMLKKSREQGICRMFATPHYYPVESVRDFLERRRVSEEKLQLAVQADGGLFPQYCLGAEVAYRPGIGYEKDLEKLCLGNSRFLLLEMPFDQWGAGIIRDIQNMTSSKGIIPILAHVERYPKQKNRQVMEQLMEQDVLMQMNAHHLLRWQTRGNGRRLLSSGTVQLLGSDCHDLNRRPPELDRALAYLEKSGMGRVIRRIGQLSNDIFEQASK